MTEGSQPELFGDGSALLRDELSSYKAASNLSMNEYILRLIQDGQQIYHLAFGQSPFPVPEELSQALKKHAEKNQYLNTSGLESARQAIIKFLDCFPTGLPKGHLSAENVILADGSKIIIYLILAVTNSVVLLKSPSWTTYEPQCVLSSAQQKVIIGSSLENQWKITPIAIEKALENGESQDQNKILIFANPCNPSGVVYTDSELLALSHTLRKYKILVICDEIYSHLTFSGEFTSLSKYYPEGCIVTSGLSKWASVGGWRVGYAIFPPELSVLRQAVVSASSHTFSCCAAPQQYAVADYLSNIEACGGFMKHCRRILEAVNLMCTRELSAVGVKVVPAAAGYYIFPDFGILKEKLAQRSIYTGKQMCDAILAEAKVSLLPGGPTHLRSPNEFTVRLCFINFDGAKALTASREIGLDKPLPDDFVNRYCSPTCMAIQELVKWCNNIMSQP